MKKKNRVVLAYTIIGVCILIAGMLIYRIFSGGILNISFSGFNGESTKFEFNVNSNKSGFSCEQTFYTDSDTTSVPFSGEITVDGSAEISFISNENNTVVHSEKFNTVNAETISFKVDGLAPDSYYTLKFISDNGKRGHLLLTTNESLSENTEPSDHPKPDRKNTY